MNTHYRIEATLQIDESQAEQPGDIPFTPAFSLQQHIEAALQQLAGYKGCTVEVKEL